MGIWNHKYETMPREALQQVQLERLQAIVNRAYENIAFYKRGFDQAGISPESIRSLDDLVRLPFTTRENLRDGYPYDAFAVPLRDVVRIHSSAGTTGAPTVCGYTVNDLHNWGELAARVLTAGGVSKDDVVQVFFGYGMFSAGFGFQHGAERIGASVIPSANEYPESRIAVMRDFKITALIGTPAYALSVADQIEKSGINSNALSLRVGLFGGVSWSDRLREQIESRLSIKTIDYYGLSEMSSPGVSWECEHRTGLHIAEDHFIAEIIDPKTCQPVEPGREGELVLTALMKEALPLIRYRTGDVTSLALEQCECGRSLARMSRVHSRTDDMLIVQGVSIFPSQIEDILTEIEGAKPQYCLVVDRQGAVDELEIQVAVSDTIFEDTMVKLTQLEERILSRIRSSLGISPRIKLVESQKLNKLTGKDGRNIIDNRE